MKDLPEDIRNMDKRIRELRKKSKKATKKTPSRLRTFCEYAFRMAADFASPVIVGLCIGYVADKFFNTKPIIMLVMVIFGVAAGTLNLYRAAQQIDKEINKE